MGRRCCVAFLSPEWPRPEVDLSQPLDLGNGVILSTAPPWVIQKAAPILEKPESRRFIQQEDAPLVLMTEYDVVYLADSTSLDEATTWARSGAAARRIHQAILALWLARPSAIGTGLSIDLEYSPLEGAPPPPMSIMTADYSPRLVPLKSYRGVQLNAEEMSEARRLNERLQALPDASVRVAVRMLERALQGFWWEGRYLMLWIALEALFGPKEDRGETTMLLASRMTAFLKTAGTDAYKLFKEIKEHYGTRSRIVHGRPPKRGADIAASLLRVEEWVREALLKLIRDQDLDRVFANEETRDNYLDRLMVGDFASTLPEAPTTIGRNRPTRPVS